jgi:hypothetical protein
MSNKTVITTASFPTTPVATLENLVYVDNKKIQTYNVSFSNSLSGVGNYYHEYEQFLTVGRKENNLDFVNSGGYGSAQFSIDLNLSASTYTLPKRANIKNVFVTKFSAPGGVSEGQTDVESGEYSPYTTVPYRNYEQREIIDYLNSNYSTKEGYDGKLGSPTASFHKVNRNPRFIIKNNATSSVFCNGNYVSNIPFYNESINWIKSRKPQFTGSANSFVSWLMYSASNTNSEIDKNIDFDINIFVNASGTYLNPTGTNHLVQSLCKDYEKPFMSDLALFSIDKKSNTYKVIQRKKTEDRKSATNSDIIITSYEEPVIDSTNYNIIFDYKEVDGSDKKIKYNFSDISFANTELDNAYNLQDTFETSTQQSLEDLKILNYQKFTLNQSIFPSKKKTSLDKSRKRKLFVFPEWRSSILNRRTDNVVSTYFSESYTSDFTYGGQRTYTTGSIWHLDMESGSLGGGGGGLPSVPSSRGELEYSTKYPVLYFYGVYSAPFYMQETPNAFSGGKGPFFDKEEEFSKDIKTKYFNYSIVPEYTCQNIINQVDVFEEGWYSSGVEDFFTTGSANALTDYFYKIKSIKNKKIEKINFKFNFVNKFRPYKNFYPVQKTLEITQILSSSFVHYSGNSPYALFRHITAPGLLYNAIKSGIPLNFPKIVNQIENVSGLDANGSQLSGSFKFEEIYNINSSIKNIVLYDITNTGESPLSATYTGSSENAKYSSCVTNFVQETQKFFMKNEDLSYFRSKSESEFDVLEANITYSLGFRIDDAFSQSISPPTSAGSYRTSSGYSSITSFGPWHITTESRAPYGLTYLNSPFVPPYYKKYVLPYTNAVSVFTTPSTFPEVHLHFIPKETRKYRLDEIFSGSFIEQISSSIIDICTGVIDTTTLTAFGIEQKYQKIDEIFKFKNTIEDVSDGVSVKKWDIAGKCEFPFFDYKHIERNITTLFSFFNGNQFTQVGLWHQYGNIPKETEGLSLSIFDITDGLAYAGKKVGSVSQKHKSLIDACGFDRKNTSKNICRLKEKIDIKELVVAIPFNLKQKKSYIINPQSTLAKNNRKLMEEYCFPPQFDEVYGVLKNSIFMVCAESVSTLTKEDLSNIWQNFMPQLSYNHEENETEIEINSSDIENIDEILSTDADWMIFKIKKRSSTNRDIATPIQYNWPYDNFSLIELLKIDAKIVYENKEVQQKEINTRSSTKEYLKSNRQIINTEKQIAANEQISEERIRSTTEQIEPGVEQMVSRSVTQNTTVRQSRSNLEKLLNSKIEAPPKKKELQAIIANKNDVTGRNRR